MRATLFLLRACGWLLTPVVALAASFLGAFLGTVLAAAIPDPVFGVGLTVAMGGLAGFATVHYWLRALRHSPRLQHALHVLPDGTPETATADAPASGEQG
jgi:sterol desaturase/sphingolipid hydroxylase (fatty acid hydroxylase superfamily)